MSRLETHIANIQQELAEMTKAGYQSSFGIETCMGCIDYECQKILAIHDKDERRQT